MAKTSLTPAVGHLPFGICHPVFVICHLSSAICHLPSAICHLPSAICHLPSAIRPVTLAMLGPRIGAPNRARSAMTRPIIPRELAARQLAVTPKALVRYEKLGL